MARRSVILLNTRQCVQIETGNFCWVSGPYFGKIADITISHNSGILSKLLPNEHIMSDLGYVGESIFLHPFKGDVSSSQHNFNRQLSVVRETMEHSFGRVKKFKFCSEIFHHGCVKHQQCFFILCNLLNLEFFHHPVHKFI